VIKPSRITVEYPGAPPVTLAADKITAALAAAVAQAAPPPAPPPVPANITRAVNSAAELLALGSPLSSPPNRATDYVLEFNGPVAIAKTVQLNPRASLIGDSAAERPVIRYPAIGAVRLLESSTVARLIFEGGGKPWQAVDANGSRGCAVVNIEQRGFARALSMGGARDFVAE
jgi:hypothetical protein